MTMDSNSDNVFRQRNDPLDDWCDEEVIDLLGREPEATASVDEGTAEDSNLARRGLDLVRSVATLFPLHLPEIYSTETPKLCDTPRETADVSGARQDSLQTGLPDFNPLQGLPARIHRFEVIRELGRGGFGVVLLARDPVLERLVALKIPRVETFGSRSARHRFEREARAVAMLTHPGIVPLFETQLEGPIQYLVFGFVPGESLDNYLARVDKPIPVQLAAKIVAALADAVEHAHQRGVIHRDLKPNNVLIRKHTPSDSLTDSELVAALCITDFGLAKVNGAAAGPSITREGAILGTPSYMSPEQASGLDENVGAASDIWSLGAILYRLLTGRPPFQGESDLATLRQLEKERPHPPHAINSNVTADLQAICLKCLEKQPADRYSRASELQADLNRWIEGRPVTARPVSQLGHLKRWILRNPRLAGALFSVVAALSIGLGVTIVQQNLLQERLQQVILEKARADTQAVAAETQAELALSIRDFLFDDLLNQADENFQIEQLDRAQALGLGSMPYQPNPTINQLVLRVLPTLEAEPLERRFPGQPLVQAELLSIVARLLTKQGQYAAALPLAERASAQFQSLFGDSDDRTLDAQHLQAVIFNGLGQFKKTKLLQTQIIQRRRENDETENDVVRSLHSLASASIKLGDQSEALKLLKQGLELELAQHEVYHPQVRRAVNVLAHYYLTVGFVRQAREILIQHYPELESELGLDGDSLANSLELLNSVEYFAECESRSGNPLRAIELLEQVVPARASLVGENQYSTILSQMVLAKAFTLAKRFDQSIATHRKILEIVIQEFGSDSLLAGTCSGNLANAYWSDGQYAQAIPLQRAMLVSITDKLGEEHPNTLIAKANLACSLRDAGQHEEAIELLESAVMMGRTNPKLKWISHELIWAYERAGKLKKAEAYCRSWLEVFLAAKNPSPYWMSKPLSSLGRLLYNSQRREEAEPFLYRIKQLVETNKIPNADKDWVCQESLVLLGACLLDQKKFEEAGPLLESGCQKLESNLPVAAFHRNVAACYQHLVRYYEQTDQPELAQKWKQKVESLLK